MFLAELQEVRRAYRFRITALDRRPSLMTRTRFGPLPRRNSAAVAATCAFFPEPLLVTLETGTTSPLTSRLNDADNRLPLICRTLPSKDRLNKRGPFASPSRMSVVKVELRWLA